jgi:hypothetical protein
MAGTLAPLAQLVRQRPNDPTVVGGAVPRGSVSLVISSMAPAGGSAKQANHGQVAFSIRTA